ncbi:MAG: hypothetical protein ABW185_20700 [Sedimenticola sp.]
MGKSRAEIQKAYRERKKASEGRNYLRKETNRVKKYYVPTVELPKKTLKRRRDAIKLCMQKKRRLSEINDEIMETNTPTITSEPGPCDSTSQDPIAGTSNERTLKVKMNFKGGRKYKPSRHFKQAKCKISTLEQKVKNMKRMEAKLRKQLWRSKTRNEMTSPVHEKSPKTLTPRSKSKAEIRAAGISPSKCPSLVKKLKFHNCVLQQAKTSIKEGGGKPAQRTYLKVLTGKLLKKYRCNSELSRRLKVTRKAVSKATQRVPIEKTRLKKVRTVLREKVVTFLERDDNSATLPGKKDAIKVGKDKHQKRVMNDYMYNVYQKFLSENPEVKMSLSVFNRCRPRYISLVTFSSRRTCLCQRHQNMALKVKAMKSARITTMTNPDSLVKQHTDDEILTRIQESDKANIEYTEWKRVDVEHKGKVTKRMQIVKSETTKEHFSEIMQNDLKEFRHHNERVKCQYEAVKQLKENLPQNHAICQMDFAENYSCGQADEVQSAYFDKSSVTLHPAVIYRKDINGNLSHKSTVYVSDTESHSAGTVYAFMKRIVPDIKSDLPNVDTIHYITDSPTSQYRNKHIMTIIGQHDKLFDGVKASWTYFEAGHGKGPCDGVGGCAKRLADSAVKRECTVIQTAEDFYNWGDSLENSKVKYMYVPKSKCVEAQDEVTTMNAKPIKGTMHVHGVVPLANNRIAVRDTSCFCRDCFGDGVFRAKCPGWNIHDLNPKSTNIVSSGVESIPDLNTETVSTPEEMDISSTIYNKLKSQIEKKRQSKLAKSEISPETNRHVVASTSVEVDINESTKITPDENAYEQKVNHSVVLPNETFVAAVYDGKWYVGEILDYDPDDNEYNVSFMTEGSNKRCLSFKWPEKPDRIWIPESAILCSVSEPELQGKTRRMYKLPQSEIDNILKKY